MSTKAKTKPEASDARPYLSREEEQKRARDGSDYLKASDVEPSDVAQWDEAKYDEARWP